MNIHPDRVNLHGCLTCHKCGAACPLCKTCKCQKPKALGSI